MDILKKLASVLRGGKPELKKTKQQAAPAAPADADKKYRIMVRNAAGELESVPATREEMLAYCNREAQWTRIA